MGLKENSLNNNQNSTTNQSSRVNDDNNLTMASHLGGGMNSKLPSIKSSSKFHPI